MTSYRAGDEIVFIDRVTIYLATDRPIHVPAGTRGDVEEVADEAGGTPVYRLRCYPATTALQPVVSIPATDTDTLKHVAPWDANSAAASPSVPLSAIYDDMMPGFLRADGAYLVEQPQTATSRSTHYLLWRAPHLDWQIEVHASDGTLSLDAIDGVLRGTLRDDTCCEQFTLMMADSEHILIQVQIFQGRMRTYVYVPAIIEDRHEAQHVVIHLLRGAGGMCSGYGGQDVERLLRRSRQVLSQAGVLEAMKKQYPFGSQFPLYDPADVHWWARAIRRHDGLVALNQRSSKEPLLTAERIPDDVDTTCPNCGSWAVTATGISETREIAAAGSVWCPECGVSEGAELDQLRPPEDLHQWPDHQPTVCYYSAAPRSKQSQPDQATLSVVREQPRLVSPLRGLVVRGDTKHRKR